MNFFLESFRAYCEIIRTGEIQSMAEGEQIYINVRGNVCGDILVFLSPKNKIALAGDMINLVRSDKQLEQQANAALNSFRKKLNGLTLIPNSLIWVVNIGFAGLYASNEFSGFCNLFAGNDILTGILKSIPVLAFAALSIFFRKRLGFWLLKPILFVILEFVRIIRRIRNRNVSVQ